MTYKEWIDAYLAREEGRILGRCREATADMSSAFPELRRVAGHVEALGWGRRAHWWLETPDSVIVDPTASQFPLVVSYEEFKAGTAVRVGRCMQCGDDLFDYPQSLAETPRHRTFCSEECSELMAKEVGW